MHGARAGTGSDGGSQTRPLLLFFTSSRDGKARRAEGYLAQVLQRRRNHETFSIRYIAQEEHPELLDRFRIEVPPALVVVENNRVSARLHQPRGAEEIQTFLAPWLK